MSEVISKTITIIVDKLPPNIKEIEQQISLNGLEPLRWAIVETNKNELTLCVSGRKIL